MQEFIAKYNGVGNVGNTTDNRGECVGLVMVWLKDQGLPHVWGHAKDLLINADRNSYNVIDNTPEAVPNPGDVIVWKQGFNNTFGHTAIVTKATVNTFEVFEQNNPLGSPCRLHTYKNYAYVDGWLRPKQVIASIPSVFVPTEPIITDQTRIPQIDNLEVQQIRGRIGDLTRDYNGALAQAGDLKRQVNEGLETIEEQKREIFKLLERCHENSKNPPIMVDPVFTNKLAILLYSVAKSLG